MKKALVFLSIVVGIFVLVVGWNASPAKAAAAKYEIKMAH